MSERVQWFRRLLDDLSHHDSVFWRRAVIAGIQHGPDAFVRLSPPAIGLVFSMLLHRHRATVRANLERVLGPRPPMREAWQVASVFSNYACALTEAFIAGAGQDRIEAEVIDDENFVAAASQGRGVIVVTVHSGGWHAAGAVFGSMHSQKVLVVMDHERDDRAQAVQDHAREEVGLTSIRVGGDPLSALPLLSHLRKGGVVAIQVDRIPEGVRGRAVTMFGKPAEIPEGPLQLAALSGAPIVPVFARRAGFLRYEFHNDTPLSLPRRPSDTELAGCAQAIADSVERFLTRFPTQWLHFS